MRILVLDDARERLGQFRANLIGHEVTTVETASDCIKALKQNLFTTAFLDHDLGGKTFVASGKGTGYEVAVWLSQHPDRCPKRVVIHSFNPVGAQNMKRVLLQAIIAPGAWTRAENFL
jgi:CheY-like chemotaxis protein